MPGQSDSSMPLRDATLVLIGHGSTVNQESSATVHQHAAELRRRGLFADVRAAFIKEPPGIRELLAEVRTPQVFGVPLFVSEGYFTRHVIPSELGLPDVSQTTLPCRLRLPGRVLTYCAPVGTHAAMTGIILARARAALAESPVPVDETQASTALVIAGHGTELNSDSRKSIERQVELIAATRVFAEVRPAFLEEAPRIEHIPNFVVAPRIVVVPFFMSDGLHVREDIPVLLGETQAIVQQRMRNGEWPWRNPSERRGKTIFYTPSVGSEPGIADIVLERARSGFEPAKPAEG
jgi:sirohydrochlorin cobaltochelatase